MEPFVWTPQLSVGVKEIDADHKILITILNRAIDTMNESEKGYIAIAEILDKVVAYTKHHFTREEIVMKVCNYPHIDNHKSVHAFLIQELYRKMQSYKQNKLSAEVLVDFLLNWLIDHIGIHDTSLAKYCEGKGSLIKDALNHIPMSEV